METLRILVAEPDNDRRAEIIRCISKCATNAEFSQAQDGTEAMFKLINATHHLAVFSDHLAKRSAFQLTEWTLGTKGLENLGMILLCSVPESERFVDEVVKGRIQFLNFQIGDQSTELEKAVARCLNFVSHGDAGEFHLRFLATQEFLMHEGEKADNVYLLRKGRMRAVRRIDNAEQILGHIEIGEFVGEMAYINGEPRSADVIADIPCELIEIPVQSLDHVLFQKPAWSRALMRTLSKRLKKANNSVAQKAE